MTQRCNFARRINAGHLIQSNLSIENRIQCGAKWQKEEDGRRVGYEEKYEQSLSHDCSKDASESILNQTVIWKKSYEEKWCVLNSNIGSGN